MLKSLKQKVAFGTATFVVPMTAAFAEGTNASMLSSIDTAGILGDISAAGGLAIGITMAFIGVMLILRVLKRS